VKTRCAWCPTDNPLYIQYHDEEWGVPVHEDRLLFEMLILEGAQAGLSWLTILKRRDSYRAAFDHFDARKIARYDKKKTDALMNDPGIIRNRLKIAATVDNARVFLDVQKEHGTFDRYIWSFVGGKTKRTSRQAGERLPAQTVEAEAMSKDLKKRGFRFVGPTICYAFMQAVGMVDDHSVDCFRAKKPISGRRKS
jgi:DNA-3-methyladenine glycosylase I